MGLALGVVLSLVTPADAARNGSGTYSLPNTGSVPNPVVTGTTITSTWANGTLSDISTEITNSLDRGGRGAMTAPLQLASGSVTAPGLTFSGDTNTGLYRVGADDVALVTSGTNRLEVSTTAITGTIPVVVTSSVTNSNGLKATGNGTGWGVWGIGGNGSAGGTVGVGGYFAAGTNGTAGVMALSSANGNPAVYGYGSASSGGGAFFGSGGSSGDGGVGGYGLSVSAGSGSTGGQGASITGGSGTSTGGVGLYVVGGAGGGSGGDGIQVSAGASSTGGTRTDAISLGNGDIEMDSVANVTSTTSITNRLTPSNLPKAWANITMGASPAVNTGFNITSVACDTGDVVVTLGGDLDATNYVCLVQVQNTGTPVDWVCRTDLAAGTVRIQTSTLTACNAGYNSTKVGIVVFGNQ